MAVDPTVFFPSTPDNVVVGTTEVVGTAVFSNSNNVSFGVGTNGVVTASATVAATPGVAVVVGAVTQTNGSVVFTQGSGVTFGLNASTLTASVAAGATATGNFGAVAAVGSTATSGTVSFSNSNNITFGMNGNTITASAGGGAPTVQLFVDQQPPPTLLQDYASFHNHPVFYPLCAGPFPGNMTVNTFNVALSGQTSVTSFPAHTVTYKLGLYALTNSTQLTLINSASTSFGSADSSSNGQQALYAGQRLLSLHSSLWSAEPVLSQTNYWFAHMVSTAGATLNLSFLNGQWGMGNQNSVNYGYLNVASFTTGAAGYPFKGVYSVTTGAFPTAVARGDVGGNYAQGGGGLAVNQRPFFVLQNGVGGV